MTLLFARRQLREASNTVELPARPAAVGGRVVTAEAAMRSSAVWASLRLRADLVSSLPSNCYRAGADDLPVEVDKPPVLVSPAADVLFDEWLYMSQIDLDRYGNTVGSIVARDGAGRPALIELADMSTVSIRKKDGQVKYRVGRKEFDRSEVWHERQYTVSGLGVGLSPLSYARLAIAAGLAAQEFGSTKFGRGGRPAAHLKYTTGEVDPAEAQVVKQRFLAGMDEGGLFVSGNDWEYNPLEQAKADMTFVQAQQVAVVDIARYFNVPADMIDGAVSGQSVTYANIGQRNLQLLTINLNPTLRRREKRITAYLTPNGQWFEFTRDALLQMDPQTRSQVTATRVASAQLAPSEGRALENRRPFTEQQWAEFDRVKGTANTPGRSDT